MYNQKLDSPPADLTKTKYLQVLPLTIVAPDQCKKMYADFDVSKAFNNAPTGKEQRNYKKSMPKPGVTATCAYGKKKGENFTLCPSARLHTLRYP
jgi:hypothetical protein